MISRTRRELGVAAGALLAVVTGLLLAAAGAGLLLVLPVTAAAQDPGRIDGTVVHGVDEQPVGGVDVGLHAANDVEGPPVATATTDEHGEFTFTGVGDTAGPYVVAARFADVTYRSAPVGTAATGVEITVYDSTEDADGVVLSAWAVWVDVDGSVEVQHDVRVDNLGDRTYLGTDPDDRGDRAVLSVPLAPGATGLRFLGRFTECCAGVRDGMYVHTTPLPPGPAVGTVRYSTDTLERLELPVTLPVEVFSLMLPPGVRVTGSVLEPSGEVDSLGRTYQVLSASDLVPGDRLDLAFSGLTAEAAPAWVVPLAVVLGLLLTGAGLAVVRRWLRRRAMTPSRPRLPRAGAVATTDGAEASPPRADTTGAVATTDGAEASPPRADACTGRSEAVTADLLVSEIALLDLAFERGLAPQDVYEPVRAARKAELLRLRASERG